MVDITKCSNDECPLKRECYRYTVESGFSEKQSYDNFQFEYFDENPCCDFFIDNKE